MRIYTFLLVLLCGVSAAGQGLSYEKLNNKRIRTNKAGMLTLTGWGTANLASGITGYAIAEDTEWRSFHGMNALWGAVNGTIGVLGYLGARKEAAKEFDKDVAFSRFQQSKNIYLINAGLDVLYVATGGVLLSVAPQFNKPDRWRASASPSLCRGLPCWCLMG